MNITVNGEQRSVETGAVVADLLPTDPRGLAVALNHAVLSRTEHATTALSDGDAVEIVTAVQGG